MAQTSPAAAAPSAAAAEAKSDRGDHHDGLSKLTHEEKMRLKAAHDAAKKDPSVIAAESARTTNPKAYRDTVRAAMLKADPSIEPLLEKMKSARKERWAERTANLTPEEKTKLHDAHRAAMKDPNVIAARDEIRKASGKDQKVAAWKKFREVSRDAMIKADPSISDILKKMRDSSDKTGPTEGR